jgi:UDP-glucose 4-epimerase
MHYLITGGAGYIGSHMATLLSEQGHDVSIVDNLSNADQQSVARVKAACPRNILFIKADLCRKVPLLNAFQQAKRHFGDIDAVLHFAGLKSVGESNALPIRYYENNITGTLNLCKIMQEEDVFTLVFSSSATVYGEPETLPLTEGHRLQTTNPYGYSKLVCEHMLDDLAKSDPRWRIGKMRYFNPIGAHPSGLIGELPIGTPNNIMPYLCQVAAKQRPSLTVFGDDYDTPDGTGVRDYIHVCDLVEGHVAVLPYLANNAGSHAFNLGSGKGYSVLELLATLEQESEQTVNYQMGARREGDVGTVYADPGKANQQLGWCTTRVLHDMVRDHWRWTVRHLAAPPAAAD